MVSSSVVYHFSPGRGCFTRRHPGRSAKFAPFSATNPVCISSNDPPESNPRVEGLLSKIPVPLHAARQSSPIELDSSRGHLADPASITRFPRSQRTPASQALEHSGKCQTIRLFGIDDQDLWRHGLLYSLVDPRASKSTWYALPTSELNENRLT